MQMAICKNMHMQSIAFDHLLTMQDGTIAPAPGPGHRYLLGPDPLALYTVTPASSPFLSQPPGKQP